MSEEEVNKDGKDRFVSAVGDVVAMQRLPNGGNQVVVNIMPFPYPEKPKDPDEVVEWEKIVAEIDAANYTMLHGLRFDRVELVQRALPYEPL